MARARNSTKQDKRKLTMKKLKSKGGGMKLLYIFTVTVSTFFHCNCKPTVCLLYFSVKQQRSRKKKRRRVIGFTYEHAASNAKTGRRPICQGWNHVIDRLDKRVNHNQVGAGPKAKWESLWLFHFNLNVKDKCMVKLCKNVSNTRL